GGDGQMMGRHEGSRTQGGARPMRRLLVAAVLNAATALSAAAQTYPAKAITIIVPFAAGGPSDAMARVLGERMRATLGQPFLIENVTGAGGSIGAGRAARAAPDGYP